jgi:GT2 family glycosyltransferase
MVNDLVSIIIVTYNGKSHLEKCLESLSKIKYQNLEIIIIDNHSTDGSLEFIQTKYPDIKTINLDDNYGFAEPNNIAVKTAMGKYLLFLNNDTVVNSNFVEELLNAMNQDPQVAISQSMLLKPNGDIDSSGDFIDTLGRAYSSKIRPTSIQYILSARGASMMVRKDIFLRLGGFDKSFFASYEDVDIGWRAWLWGYKVVLAPSSIVYHTGGQTIKQLDSLIMFHAVKNSMILFLTNFESFFAFKSLIIFSFIIMMRKIFRISIVKDPEQKLTMPSFKIIAKAIFWILKNSKYILAKRKQVNSNKIFSNNDLIQKGLITKYHF